MEVVGSHTIRHSKRTDHAHQHVTCHVCDQLRTGTLMHIQAHQRPIRDGSILSSELHPPGAIQDKLTPRKCKLCGSEKSYTTIFGSLGASGGCHGSRILHVVTIARRPDMQPIVATRMTWATSSRERKKGGKKRH